MTGGKPSRNLILGNFYALLNFVLKRQPYRDREKIRWELEKILTKEDSLLIAGLCDRCFQRVMASNRSESWTIPESVVQIF
jgi:CRISPR-associated protein Cas2